MYGMDDSKICSSRVSVKTVMESYITDLRRGYIRQRPCSKSELDATSRRRLAV
jgi:hypothetical protein